jgi:hypothetical protein
MKHFIITSILEGCDDFLNRCKTSVKNLNTDGIEVIHKIYIDPKNNRQGAMHGQVQLLSENIYNDEDVIHILDGDDTLQPNALKSRDEIFQSPNILVCWGGYRDISTGILNMWSHPWVGGPPRKIKWTFSHMRSFRYGLYKQIPHSYLKIDGHYVMTCPDLAVMTCLTELAGPERCFCASVPIVYDYNDALPLNEAKTYEHEMHRTAVYLRSLPPLKFA